jgi:iron only hydrogenase large subunit-like protein
MACEGGCVQGAGCFVRSPRNRLDVEKHAKQAEGRTILDTVRSMESREEVKEEISGEKTSAKATK